MMHSHQLACIQGTEPDLDSKEDVIMWVEQLFKVDHKTKLQPVEPCTFILFSPHIQTHSKRRKTHLLLQGSKRYSVFQCSNLMYALIETVIMLMNNLLVYYMPGGNTAPYSPYSPPFLQ